MYTLNEVLESVLVVSKLERKEFFARDRQRKIVNARQVFCYLARRHSVSTLKELGGFLGQHHTSVIHSIHFVTDMLSIEDEVITNYVHKIEGFLCSNYAKSEKFLVTVPIDVDKQELFGRFLAAGCTFQKA